MAIYALALVVPTLPSSDGKHTLQSTTDVGAGIPHARVGVGSRRRLLGTCETNERVNGTNTCVACATGSVNEAGDDPTGPETHCTCPEDYRVSSSECVACVGGSTRAAGDNPLEDGDTACGCAIDERVDNRTCTACPAGSTNVAGDDPLGVAGDTFCEPVAYVELLVVNDKARCEAFDTASEMHAHTAAVVASVGTIFASMTGFPTKTRVVLVGQVDWCDGDEFDEAYFNSATHEGIVRDGYLTPETDADALLSAFGIWRDENLNTIAKNDVAHLFTGRDLTANSVGGAYQYSACSDDSSYCGTTNPEDPSKILRHGDCAFDSSVGATGATVCCIGRRGGAVSSVADPSNANTIVTGYDAMNLVFESALIVSHHLGKQLGMEIDGTGNSINCPATGYVMAKRTGDDRYRPEAAGRFSQFSQCSAAKLEQQLPTYTCLFRETAGRSICGNGVVETERGEQCDCGGGDSDGVCSVAEKGSFVDDAYCNATTCLFIADASPSPPPPFPPPATYEPHAWCDAGCGEARVKGVSVRVTDVPWNMCLRCTANYLEEDCYADAAPYKGWVDDAGGTRNTACAWTGCVADSDGSGCDDGKTETASEICDADGAIGTNRRCCEPKPLWSCCGLLSCTSVTASPPPPFPPPSPLPPPAAAAVPAATKPRALGLGITRWRRHRFARRRRFPVLSRVCFDFPRRH